MSNVHLAPHDKVHIIWPKSNSNTEYTSESSSNTKYTLINSLDSVTPLSHPSKIREGQNLGFTFVEADCVAVWPLIQDFLDHAEWILPGRVRNRIVPGLILMSTYDGRFLP